MTISDPTTDSAARQDNRRAGTGWRHLLGVVVITLLIAACIAWAAGAFKPAPKIAFITSTEDVYWDRVIAGAKAAAEQFGVPLEVIRSRDESHQTQTVRDLLSRGVKGIGISPVNAEGQTPLIKEASSRAAVVTFDSDAPNSERAGFVGTDNYLAGRQCAQLVKEAMPDGGEIVICVGSVDNVNGRSRRQGVIDALLDRPVDPNRTADPLDAPIKGGKFTILVTLLDGGDPAKAVAHANDAIAKNANLKGMIGLWSYSIPSILEALKQHNKLGQIKVIGFDEAEPTLAGIEAGHVQATLVQDQFNMGYDAVRLLLEVINKLPPPAGISRTQYLPIRPVTDADDVAMIRYEQEREKQKQSQRPQPAGATTK